MEPHQSLQGDYLQVGDTLTQDSAGIISTSSITSATTPYVINNSVAFNGSSSYLYRTPSVASNRKQWTWSGWVKRGEAGVTHRFFSGFAGSNNDQWTALFFSTSDQLVVGGYSVLWRLTERTFTDPNAWHHIVVAYDLDNSDQQYHIRAWVDGEIATWDNWSGSPTTGGINMAAPHSLGSESGSNYYNGYLADIQFVDGLALEASYFGEYNSSGVWVPKAADLTRLSSYETRPIADQVWSSLATLESGSTWNSSYPVTNMFDGDLSSEGGLTYTAGQSGTLNFTGLGTISKLRIYANLLIVPSPVKLRVPLCPAV